MKTIRIVLFALLSIVLFSFCQKKTLSSVPLDDDVTVLTGDDEPPVSDEGKDVDKKLLCGKKWMHSFEEDQNTTLAFRPEGFSFPPARGRMGYTFNSDGSFVMHEIAHGDGNTDVPGKWTSSKGTITITLNDSTKHGFTLKVVSLTTDILKLTKL